MPSYPYQMQTHLTGLRCLWTHILPTSCFYAASAMSLKLHFTVLSGKEIAFACSAASSPITTLTISLEAGTISSSPVCFPPFFAIGFAAWSHLLNILIFSLPVTRVDSNLFPLAHIFKMSSDLVEYPPCSVSRRL